MKITVSTPLKELFDDNNNAYTLKDLLPTGRLVLMSGKTAGWQYWVGKRLIRVTLR